MKKLIKECALAIKENRCLGCTALEDEEFEGVIDCKFSKIPPAEETIAQIKMILGVDQTGKGNKRD